jgi:3-oxoacyl-[acyl-carrier-protein] synthase III
MRTQAEDGIGIDHLDFYLPERSYGLGDYPGARNPPFSLETLEGFWKDIWFEPDLVYRHLTSHQPAQSAIQPEWTAAEIANFQRRSGIERVYCAVGETSADMAVKVGKQILAREPNLAKTVDGVIYYHSILNEAPILSTSCRLQYELGLKNAFAFSVGQKRGGASLVALKIACEMMEEEEEAETLLLIGSEKFVPPYERRVGTMTIAGDSASAMLVRRRAGRFRPLGFNICDCPELIGGCSPGETKPGPLIEKAAEFLNETLKNLGLGWERIDLVIPSNINLSLLRSLSIALGCPWEKFYNSNIPRYGYLASSDMVVNLSSVAGEGRLKSGDLVLAISLGLDHSLGCVLLAA